MKIIETPSLNKRQKETVFNLWNIEYPEKLAYTKLEDFDEYLNNLTEQNHYLIIDIYENIKGWALVFNRESERWFAIIISEDYHGKGIGSLVLNKLQEKYNELNGWVIDHERDKKSNGKIYKSPIYFYKKNKFEIMSGIRLELEKISAVKITWKK